jgi:hypothetical protein
MYVNHIIIEMTCQNLQNVMYNSLSPPKRMFIKPSSGWRGCGFCMNQCKAIFLVNLWYSQSGNLSIRRKNLAKVGYKWDMKVKLIEQTLIFLAIYWNKKYRNLANFTNLISNFGGWKTPQITLFSNLQFSNSLFGQFC